MAKDSTTDKFYSDMESTSIETEARLPFDQLNLRAELLRAISDLGYHACSPIQQQSLPLSLQGADIIGQAQTGTGKTAGFTLPLLQMLASQPVESGQRPVRALVIAPTRELAAQARPQKDVNKDAKYLFSEFPPLAVVS